jgi:hypothetical protein
MKTGLFSPTLMLLDEALLLLVGWEKKLGFRRVDDSRYVHDRVRDW